MATTKTTATKGRAKPTTATKARAKPAATKAPTAKGAATKAPAAKRAATKAPATTATKAPATKTPAAKTPATKAAAAAPAGELATLSFTEPAAWGAWLAENHASSRGVWLRFAKKASGVASLTYAQALEEALTWGWIDGQSKGIDATYWRQRYTPRGPKSLWSKINREKALALIASGKMRPPGLEQVERARRDGRWDAAYDSPGRATVPDDLAAALAATPRAKAFFATLDSRNRYAVLYRVQTAKRPETRARNIARFVEMLARGEKLHP
ncbi:MAG TPA: YdeI/OmpD-associated family protein [Polyangiaceae bacterium]|nr:YdeI/OmpD-associated family protein [Polyangiaceae bacterium]